MARLQRNPPPEPTQYGKGAAAVVTTASLDWRLQFIKEKGGAPLGELRIADRRLDRAILDALGSHPAFEWDEDLNGYIVDLSVANPPHRVNAAEKPSGRQEPRSNNKEEAPAPARSAPLAIELVSNPRWQGKGSDSYSSRYGWRLEFVKEREPGLPRGDRGKHWKLTHEKSANEKEAWFHRKNKATDAILTGWAAKFFSDIGG
jgi:hypothetical protein